MTLLTGKRVARWPWVVLHRLGFRGCVIALVAVSLVLWLPYLTFPLDADAAGYAVAAHWWARGDILYEDITITRPQGIFVIFRILEALHLDSAVGNHIVSALWAAACTLVLLALASRIWGRAIGFASATVFAFLVAAPFTEGYSTNAELFMLLPVLGALYCLWLSRSISLTTWRAIGCLVLCGYLGAIAVLIKPSATPIMLFCVVWSIHCCRPERSERLVWWRAPCALGIGCCIGLLPALIHGLATVPDSYLGVVLFYRLQHDSAAAGSLAYQSSAFLQSSVLLLLRLPVLILSSVGLWPTRSLDAIPALTFLRGWTLAAFLGVAMGGNWFPHYYLPLLAPLAVGVALGARRLLRYCVGPEAEYPGGRVLGGICTIGVALIGISLFNTTAAMLSPAKTYSTTVSRSERVSSYIRAHSDPSETIYVVYQWPSIYQLAQRKPATRWLYYRELQRFPDAFAEQVVRVNDPQTAPRYIVAAQPFASFGFDAGGDLQSAVEQSYILETTIEGILIYRHR